MVNASETVEKSKKCRAISDYFRIETIDDLILRMPYMVAHDFSIGRRTESEVYKVKPSKTVDRVYESIPKNPDGSIYGVYFPADGSENFPSNEELKEKNFKDVCRSRNGRFTSIILTCIQQANFAADLINYYLKNKSKNKEDISGDKARVTSVWITDCKKRNYADMSEIRNDKGQILAATHAMVLYNNRLYDCSNNIKDVDKKTGKVFDVTNLPFRNANVREIPIWNSEKREYVIRKSYDADKEWENWQHKKN